jgi:hypothetical protein
MTLKNKLKLYAMDNHYKKHGELNAKNLENIADMYAIDFAEWCAYNAYERWIDNRWFCTPFYENKENSLTTIELLYKFKIEKKL